MLPGNTCPCGNPHLEKEEEMIITMVAMLWGGVGVEKSTLVILCFLGWM